MRQLNKIFMYILLMTVVTLYLPMNSVEAAQKMSKDSTVAHIDVEGLTYEKVREVLQEEVDLWQSQAAMIAEQTEGDAVYVSRDVFQFDIENTLDRIMQQSERPWYLFFKKREPVHLALDVQVAIDKIDPTVWPAYIDIEASLEKMKAVAANLDSSPVEMVFKSEEDAAKELLAEVTFPIPDTYLIDMEAITNEIDGQVIAADDHFSLINAVLENVHIALKKDRVNFFATALYELNLKTNLVIVERHSQDEIPAYSKAGIEAAIDIPSQKDFIIYNPNHYAYTIHATIENNNLNLSLHSVLMNREVDYSVTQTREVKPKTLYRYSYDLEPGAKVPLQTGKKGSQVEVYRIESVDGDIEDRTLVSRDYYPPTPTIFQVSTQPEERVEEVEQETSLDESLKGLIEGIYGQETTGQPNPGEIQALMNQYLLFQELMKLASGVSCDESAENGDENCHNEQYDALKELIEKEKEKAKEEAEKEQEQEDADEKVEKTDVS